MTKCCNTTRREWLAYALVWSFMFLAPLVSLYVHASLDDNITFRWADVLYIWGGLAVMLVLFFIHNTWVAPLLTHHHRTRVYILSSATLILLFTLFQCTRRPPQRSGSKPPEMEVVDKGTTDIPPPQPPKRGMIPPMDINKMMSVMMLALVFAANLGTKYTFKGLEESRRRQTLEKEDLKQELTYLKHQMNPHFFMNTLNNIHALVDIDPEKAKACIVKLGHMMRYMLYECNKDTVTLARGVAMMEHHIELMRIRYDETVDIQFNHPDQIPNIEIPPLIIIPFVENAFKHGISYSEHSFIHITVDIDDTHFMLTCDNSKHADNNSEHGGVGLKNVIKRLDLIYGDQYKLDIDNATNHYMVSLVLPIAPHKASDATQ